MGEDDRTELVARFRERYPAAHSLFIAFTDCKLEVRTSTGVLRSRLADYYKVFLCDETHADILITVHQTPEPELDYPFVVKPPDSGKTGIKEEYADLNHGRIVRKRRTGMVFIFGAGDNVAVGPCLENVSQIVNFINNRYIEWRLNKGCLLGHAAGVAWEERGLALAGFSGMGKSTLALHLMCRGTSFVTNDRMLIEKTGNRLVMHGVAKEPRINPGTALSIPELAQVISKVDQERFSVLPEAQLWHLEYKYDAPIEMCFGPNRHLMSSPMNGLVILNWRRNNGPLVVRLVDIKKSYHLLSAFKKKRGLFYLPGHEKHVQDPSLSDYAALLSDCAVMEMTGGTDFAGATAACMHFLETGGIPASP